MSGRSYGRTQAQRGAGALDPRSAPVDQRSLAQSLAYAAQYAKLLNFHELNGSVSGDWCSLFDSEISFLLAEVATLDLDQLQFEAARLLRRLQWDHSAEGEAVEYIYASLRRLEGWFGQIGLAGAAALQRAGAQSGTLGLFQAVLEDLASNTLGSLLGEVRGQPHWAKWWNQAWQREQACQAARPPCPPWFERAPWLCSAQVPLQERDHSLRRMINAITSANARLRALAAQVLQTDLAQRSDHAPHSTLMMAFAELLEVLRDDMNGFTARHLDYYYRQVLALGEAKGRHDSGYVMFKLAPSFPSYLLKRGSLLSAGQDASGAAVVYATERDLLINQGAIASLSTLYLSRDAAGNVDHALAAPAANLVDGLGNPVGPPEEGWATFGRVSGALAGKAKAPARFGLVVTSPVLALAEGKRHVSIRFSLDPAALADLLGALQARFRAASPQMNKVLRDGLTVALSGAKKWIAVPRFLVRYSGSGALAPSVELRFTLDADQPAVVPNRLLEAAADGPWPCVRILLNPNAPVHLFSFLAKAVPEQVEIRVDVRGLAAVQLAGSVSGMSPAAPFVPFGNLGDCGGYFSLYHPELGKQHVTCVAVRLDWLNLPYTPSSFRAWYEGYGPGFDSALYQLDLEQYSGRRWQSVGARVRLFQDAAGDSTLASSLHLKPRALPPADQDAIAPAAPDSVLNPGALRFTLAAPLAGFGQSRYPQAFSDRALANAAQIRDGKPAYPTLNPPLVPLVKAVRCDYAASDTIALVGRQAGDVSAPRLYQLTPFGMNPWHPDTRMPLLRDDGYDGRLFIGMTGLCPPQEISLHLSFRELQAAMCALERGASEPIPGKDEQVVWRYLSATGWKDFEHHAIESSLSQFKHSGVITLALPADIVDSGRAMPAGQFWIEARARGNALDTLSIGVLAQAVAVRRQAPSAGPDAPVSLAAGQIKSLMVKTPAVASVLQAYPTNGGAPAESAHRFRIRVSERLKHKQRACQPGDYEQLVLEGFPCVHQVKCITFNNSQGFRGRPPPGEVVLAVAPPTLQGALAPPFPLRVLSDIAHMVQQHSSGFITKITVYNVRYEYIKVFVNVDFAPGTRTDAAIVDLNRAISGALAPWMADSDATLPLGGEVMHGRVLADFIRKQPNVVRISPVHMLCHWHCDGRLHQHLIDEQSALRLASPWSVVVPDVLHEIIAGDGLSTPQPGIGNVAVRDMMIAGLGAARGLAAARTPRYFVAVPVTAPDPTYLQEAP